MDDLYIDKVRDGDTKAYSYFIRKYQDMAFSLAVSILKDEFAAEEAVQDAFIKAFNGLANFSGKSSFKTWFYRIVLNEAFLSRKRQQRHLLDYTAVQDEEIPDKSAIAQLEQTERTYLINEALKQLPDKEAVVLRLFYLEEESIKAVCDITGWSEANVKVLLHRARKSLAAVLHRLIKKTERL